MSQRRVYVRKIRPSDAGFDQPSAKIFPWLCLPHRNATFGRGFRTQREAFRYAERVAVGSEFVFS